MKHNTKWILEHLELEGQMEISDFPQYCPSEVDNSVTDVDNIPDIPFSDFCDICPPFECVGCKLHG